MWPRAIAATFFLVHPGFVWVPPKLAFKGVRTLAPSLPEPNSDRPRYVVAYTGGPNTLPPPIFTTHWGGA